MHELCDVKKLFETNGVKVKTFNGHTLVTEKGEIWTMVLGEFYKNGIPIKEQDLIDSVVPPKKPKTKK